MMAFMGNVMRDGTLGEVPQQAAAKKIRANALELWQTVVQAFRESSQGQQGQQQEVCAPLARSCGVMLEAGVSAASAAACSLSC